MKKKERKRYMTPGKWYYPQMRNFTLGCCECGLLHKVDFKVEKDSSFRRMAKAWLAATCCWKTAHREQVLDFAKHLDGMKTGFGKVGMRMWRRKKPR